MLLAEIACSRRKDARSTRINIASASGRRLPHRPDPEPPIASPRRIFRNQWETLISRFVIATHAVLQHSSNHMQAIRLRPCKTLIVDATAGQAELLVVAEGIHRVPETSLRDLWIAALAS